MDNKGVYIFLGPPFSGKETQTMPLSHKLGIPVFSMGSLIRESRQSKPDIEEAFQEYTTKGLHVPIDIKFGLLKEEMDKYPEGFILDNFPATAEDLKVFNDYVDKQELTIIKVFYLNIGYSEIVKRFEENPFRGRADDTIEAIETRSRVQSEDRQAVLDYYRELGKLVEINGEKLVDEVKQAIYSNL